MVSYDGFASWAVKASPLSPTAGWTILAAAIFLDVDRTPCSAASDRRFCTLLQIQRRFFLSRPAFDCCLILHVVCGCGRQHPRRLFRAVMHDGIASGKCRHEHEHRRAPE